MNVNNLIRKVLLEADENKSEARGINYKNTAQVLNSGKNSADASCASLKGLGNVSQMTPTFPPTDDKTPLINKFKEIYDLKPEAVAFAPIKDGNRNVVVFGVVDPNTQSGQRALYAYDIIQGQPPIRRPNGAGAGCIELQKFEDVGKVPLSEYDKAIVDSLFGKFNVLYDTPDKTQMGNYEQVFLKDIPGIKNPQNGFIWVQKSAALQKFRNTNEDVNQTLIDQGFTATQPPQNQGGKFGFSLSMVQMNVGPGGKPTDYYWPDPEKPGIAPELDPDRETCRTVIKKLHGCMTQELKRGQTSTECDVDVVKNKWTALRCQTLNFIGGPIGLGNEFEDLLKDATTAFGLRRMKLANISPKIPGVQTESSLEKRINKLLNEESKKFTFNKPKMSDYNFDQKLIDQITYKAIVESIFNIQKVAPQIRNINENIFGDVAGAFGSGWMDKLVGGGKEFLASKVISMLGFNPNSYVALVFKNIFANLDFNEYDEFISNCPKFTKVIVKSALEAWLDYAWANGMKDGKDQINSIVYMALKNMVTETAANTSVYVKLESVAAKVVCPMITGIADSIKSGDINPLG